MEIQDSVQHLLQHSEAFAEQFYARYLNLHPEVRHFFAHLDMKRQGVMLNMALVLVAHHYQHHFPATENYLRVLGQHHHLRRAVPPEAYPLFNATLLEVLEQFHDETWNEHLADQWRSALELATKVMLEGYEGTHSV